MNSATLERVRKLLALATNNPNSDEAQQALLKAQEMLGRETWGNDSRTQQAEHRVVAVHCEPWQIMLAGVIADNFRVHMYVVASDEQPMYFGLPDDLDTAVEVYTAAFQAAKYLCEQWARAQQKLNKQWVRKEARQAWCIGFVRGLHDRFQGQTEGQKMALLVQSPAGVREAFEGFLKERKAFYKTDPEAPAGDEREAGYQAGRAFVIEKDRRLR